MDAPLSGGLKDGPLIMDDVLTTVYALVAVCSIVLIKVDACSTIVLCVISGCKLQT